ncbi:glutathione S-transferase family protein [Labrenzia sp. PHM005]|uniref:glutathione S-transferase family protein n=1 Tax=Labrenzia sp. PHM005 TaxID=2590016 RepID=UPI0011401D29|nr:glutathione S-transferase C-terminal domain-containing protein [Labrenzia sp. PHM005]QDG76731.1 glutathione S-transferase family protein [Labrenzia sp. PHM005]
MLIDGKWSADWHPYQKTDEGGRFVRQVSSFRTWITADGAPGPEGQPALKAEADRFHLFVNYICPWAGRTLIVRNLKKLEELVTVSVLEPVMSPQGWRFGDFPGASGADTEIGATYMHEIYTWSDQGFTGRASVPVLWDKKQKRILNNESADIIRIFDRAFQNLTGEPPSLRPQELGPDIQKLSERLYETFNNGVYRAGFAQSQSAYEEAVGGIFATLDDMETRLGDGRSYLFGDNLTEVDVRFYVTLIRFDAAYLNLFKCNLRPIRDYPHLRRYLRRLYVMPEFGKATFIDHIKAGYYSIKALNPSGIIPLGPDLDYLN